MSGGVIPWDQFWQQRPPSLVTVEFQHATFDRVTLDQLPDQLRLSFRHCRFLGLHLLRSGSHATIEYHDCRFDEGIVWNSPAVEGVFRGCDFFERVIIRLEEPQRLQCRDSRFHRSLRIALLQSPVSANQFSLFACQFADRVEFDIKRPLDRLFLTNCSFLATSDFQLTIHAMALGPVLYFQSSTLAGSARFVMESATILPAHQGAMLLFYSVKLTGKLDLRKLRIAKFGLLEADLNDGSIELGPEQIQAADLYIPDDQAARESYTRLQPSEAKQRRFEGLARMFESLAKAIARAPGSIEQLDFCLFQMNIYRLRDQIERAGGWPWLVAAAGLIVALVGSVTCVAVFNTDALRLMIPFLGLLFLGLLAFFSPPELPQGRDARTYSIIYCCYILNLAWRWIVIELMLGYGIRIRNIFVSSGALIAIFAAIYLTASKFTPHTSGYIKVGDSNFAVVVDLQAAHPFVAPAFDRLDVEICDALYYSVITFTTVGYGDFTPQGRMRTVAACEAILGAIMIALVTVIFARKFLRA